MAESKYIELEDSSSNDGSILIAPEIVETIASITVEQIEGVHISNNSITKSFNAILRGDTNISGIKLVVDNQKLLVEVNVVLDFGVSVPLIASKIQERVQQQLLFMTGLVVDQVNIQVDGMLPDSDTPSEIDPNNIFAEKNGEEL